MIAAAVILFAAALIGLAANPIARWWARGECELDGLIDDALDRPDLEAAEDWWNAQGRSQLR